jgi:hypothetical protein
VCEPGNIFTIGYPSEESNTSDDFKQILGLDDIHHLRDNKDNELIGNTYNLQNLIYKFNLSVYNPNRSVTHPLDILYFSITY